MKILNLKMINEANSQIAVTQMSFDTIGDNNLKDEILNLDLLNMTPLDAINALYSLQKKAKNNPELKNPKINFKLAKYIKLIR